MPNAFSLAIIIPCYNDYNALIVTLESLKNNLIDVDEVIVVDSSPSNDEIKSILKGEVDLNIQYRWTPPSGVYAAQNIGVKMSSSDWIQILGCGDLLMQDARGLIDRAISSSPEAKIHVFRQFTGLDGRPINILIPSDCGVWPHQSIVVSSDVYDEMGEYNETLKLVSDQLFFAKARKIFNWKIHDQVLTYYDLDGISSRVSLSQSREVYLKWRALGRGRFNSFFRAVVSPWSRLLLEAVLGKRTVARLKKFIKPKSYSSI